LIETKVWISDYGYDETLHAIEKTVGKLGVDQIDLLLLRQPVPTDLDRTTRSTKPWRNSRPTARLRPSASATSWPTT
jgi:diketogulonate reductase-like aldo/keto reductase